jgi:hypothetical protein
VPLGGPLEDTSAGPALLMSGLKDTWSPTASVADACPALSPANLFRAQEHRHQQACTRSQERRPVWLWARGSRRTCPRATTPPISMLMPRTEEDLYRAARRPARDVLGGTPPPESHSVAPARSATPLISWEEAGRQQPARRRQRPCHPDVCSSSFESSRLRPHEGRRAQAHGIPGTSSRDVRTDARAGVARSPYRPG